MKGHVRKRGNKWSFAITLGKDPVTGKRKQKTVSGFTSEKEAEEALIKYQYEWMQGVLIDEDKISFEKFAYQWLEIYQETNNVKPGTIRVRKHEIGRLLPYLAKLSIRDINRTIYQNALNDLKEKGYADRTIEGVHRTGRMIFRKAVELEKIKKDPTEFAYLKKTKKTIEELEQEELPNYLEKEELSLFLKTSIEQGLDQDDVIFHVLAYSGMRVGELCVLKWKDIDFNKRTISITKTLYNPNNNYKKYELVPPKTKKSRRKIVMDGSIMQLLKKQLHQQNEIKMLYRNGYYDAGFVFTSQDEEYAGYPIVVKKIELRMKRLLKLANLSQSITPHSLRHTHTSLLAEAGVQLEQIMDRLGHSDDKTTRNVYLHVTESLKEEASHKFSELMKSLNN